MSFPELPHPIPTKPDPELSDSVFELFSLKGKVAVVTGAGGGIGLAAADAFAEAGAKVIITYKSNDKAHEEAEKLSRKWNTTVKATKLEVTSLEELEQLVKDVTGELGRIDVWVANAGIVEESGVGIVDEPIEVLHRVAETNYRSVYLQARAVGNVFKRQGKGSFIITSSAAGWVMNRPASQPIYNSSKAAVRHFGASLAYEWRDFARVNSISPGYFLTGLGALPEELNVVHTTAFLGRQGNPKELKGIYLYLASDASTYTTGSDFLVDGGLSKA